MRVRTCTRCGRAKPLDQFPPVRRSEPEKLQTWCRACFAENNARYYREHRDAQKARLYRNAATRRMENKRRIVEFLTTHACVDCGEADIVVLEFDHLRDKAFSVSELLRRGASWARIEREIAKCEVRCANCHARKTAKERGYRKVSATPSALAPEALHRRRPVQMELGTGETLTCRVCHFTKPATEFPYRSAERGTRQYICHACQSDYHRQWWAKNRVVQMPRIRRNRKKRDNELAQRIWDILFESPCVDCGEMDLTVLQFDHLRDKVRDISTMWRSQHSWAAVRLEMAKCDVRCANCHARKTARETGSYRTKAV